MDPVLYYRIYEKEMDKQIIPRYNEPVKPYKLYYLTTDHVWRD